MVGDSEGGKHRKTSNENPSLSNAKHPNKKDVSNLSCLTAADRLPIAYRLTLGGGANPKFHGGSGVITVGARPPCTALAGKWGYNCRGPPTLSEFFSDGSQNPTNPIR